MELVGRTFNRGCRLDVHSLVPYLGGIEVAPLVPHLDAFPRKDAWSIWLRRPLVSVTREDATLIRDDLAHVAPPLRDNIDVYLRSIKPVAAASTAPR
ncbi:hypothetical protein [Actinopolymorpha pittospori]